MELTARRKVVEKGESAEADYASSPLAGQRTVTSHPTRKLKRSPPAVISARGCSRATSSCCPAISGRGRPRSCAAWPKGSGIDPAEVTSPTFTLIQEYRGGRLPLYHVDLYRLKPIEVDDLGLDELTTEGGVTAIEWPDRLPRPFDEAIEVRIEHGDDNHRTIHIDR